LLGLFFDLEDGGNMFLQNIDWLSVDSTAYISGDRALGYSRLLCSFTSDIKKD
jgi:hypothetical protein